ncbi:MAG: Gfo/Idh/MocA family protein [Opitutales bacterium]|jgi:predicted dehydrogenase
METPRRDFIRNAALAGAALAASNAYAAGNGPRIKVGLIGCGGRGNGAISDFLEACKVLNLESEVTAVGDAFKSQADAVGDRLKLAPERRFHGFDAYRKVIASGCDYVVMATPPAFRPLHFAAAVEAGKHCFIEKPVAVDPVGARAVIATGEVARTKGLAVVAGTQRRHTASYVKNKMLIDLGAIGPIRGGVVQWNGVVPWIKRRTAGESAADYLARNWLNFTEMSGDHIVEQHVHNLDVAVWYLGRPPVSAVGFGGRARRETGNQFDFFSVDFDFGDDVHIHSQCRQLAGTWGRVGEMFTGADGSCFGGGRIKPPAGRKLQEPEVKFDTDNAMVQEHVDLIRSVLTGKPLNEARQIADSTMVAIMGRISSYTGDMVRWTDLTRDAQSPWYNLALSPAPADFESGKVTLPEEKPTVPGKA